MHLVLLQGAPLAVWNSLAIVLHNLKQSLCISGSFFVMDSLYDDIRATDLSAELLTTLMLATSDLALSNSGLSVQPAGVINGQLSQTADSQSNLLE